MAYKFQGFMKKIRIPQSNLSISYTDKISELNSQLNEEARKLQKLDEQKDNFLKEFAEIVGRKSALLAQIGVLENKVSAEKALLEETKDTKKAFIDSAKVELKQETEKLKSVQEHISLLSEELQNLEIVAAELHSFLDKKKEARLEYLTEKEKLDNVKKTHDIISKKALKTSKEIEEKNKQLDDYRKNMTDWSGRLTTGLYKVREATKELNERLDKEGIPVEFDLPP